MNILVVDDDSVYVDLVRAILESRNVNIHSASTGVEALEILTKSGTTFDLIICDIDMPAMDGISFHERIQQDCRLRSIRFVFVTGTDDPSTLSHAQRISGRMAFSKDRLTKLLPTFLEGRS